ELEKNEKLKQLAVLFEQKTTGFEEKFNKLDKLRSGLAAQIENLDKRQQEKISDFEKHLQTYLAEQSAGVQKARELYTLAAEFHNSKKSEIEQTLQNEINKSLESLRSMLAESKRSAKDEIADSKNNLINKSGQELEELRIKFINFEKNIINMQKTAESELKNIISLPESFNHKYNEFTAAIGLLREKSNSDYQSFIENIRSSEKDAQNYIQKAHILTDKISAELPELINSRLDSETAKIILKTGLQEQFSSRLQENFNQQQNLLQAEIKKMQEEIQLFKNRQESELTAAGNGFNEKISGLGRMISEKYNALMNREEEIEIESRKQLEEIRTFFTGEAQGFIERTRQEQKLLEKSLTELSRTRDFAVKNIKDKIDGRIESVINEKTGESLAEIKKMMERVKNDLEKNTAGMKELDIQKEKRFKNIDEYIEQRKRESDVRYSSFASELDSRVQNALADAGEHSAQLKKEFDQLAQNLSDNLSAAGRQNLEAFTSFIEGKKNDAGAIVSSIEQINLNLTKSLENFSGAEKQMEQAREHYKKILADRSDEQLQAVDRDIGTLFTRFEEKYVAPLTANFRKETEKEIRRMEDLIGVKTREISVLSADIKKIEDSKEQRLEKIDKAVADRLSAFEKQMSELNRLSAQNISQAEKSLNTRIAELAKKVTGFEGEIKNNLDQAAADAQAALKKITEEKARAVNAAADKLLAAAGENADLAARELEEILESFREKIRQNSNLDNILQTEYGKRVEEELLSLSSLISERARAMEIITGNLTELNLQSEKIRNGIEDARKEISVISSRAAEETGKIAAQQTGEALEKFQKMKSDFAGSIEAVSRRSDSIIEALSGKIEIRVTREIESKMKAALKNLEASVSKAGREVLKVEKECRRVAEQKQARTEKLEKTLEMKITVIDTAVSEIKNIKQKQIREAESDIARRISQLYSEVENTGKTITSLYREKEEKTEAAFAKISADFKKRMEAMSNKSEEILAKNEQTMHDRFDKKIDKFTSELQKTLSSRAENFLNELKNRQNEIGSLYETVKSDLKNKIGSQHILHEEIKNIYSDKLEAEVALFMESAKEKNEIINNLLISVEQTARSQEQHNERLEAAGRALQQIENSAADEFKKLREQLEAQAGRMEEQNAEITLRSRNMLSELGTRLAEKFDTEISRRLGDFDAALGRMNNETQIKLSEFFQSLEDILNSHRRASAGYSEEISDFIKTRSEIFDEQFAGFEKSIAQYEDHKKNIIEALKENAAGAEASLRTEYTRLFTEAEKNLSSASRQ
ncbi:MAG TPA: hypothetical protein DC049_04245, partial [Spirochaetia bacterium]|nr:hypothetical protein [Spirochaetia bacterium]